MLALLMFLQVSLKSERFLAMGALERFVVDMNVIVHHEVLTSREHFTAYMSFVVLE